MLRVVRFFSYPITRAWRAAQVELHGEYSTGRLLSLRDYCERASTLHCLLVLVVTPLPCLVAALLIECIPLRPPADGLEHSAMLWLRTFAVMLAVEFSMLQQCRCLVPRLPSAGVLQPAATVVAALGSTAGMLGLSYAVGFPLPFIFLTGAPVTVALMLLSMLALWGRFLMTNQAERVSFFYYFAVIPVQVGLACAYPAYAFVFVQLSAGRQVAAMAIIPAIKVLIKNVLVKICRGDGDLKPLVVVLNAEVYHMLFFSWCMNSTTSKAAVAALALSDVLETAVALYDVNQVLARVPSRGHGPQLSLLQGAAAALASPRSSRSAREQGGGSDVGQAIAKPTVLPAKRSVRRWRLPAPRRLRVLPAGEKALDDSKASQQQLRAVIPAPQSAGHRVAPALEPITSDGQNPQQLLAHTRRLLYLTEFVLLVEYMEVVTPCLYSLYLLATFHLPSRAFLSNLRDLTPRDLLANVAVLLGYSLFELASLLALGLVLQRRTRVSALRQLAFVLETHWLFVQVKLLSWVVFTVQTPLEHYGTDYSFRFEWLKHEAKDG